MRLGIGLLVGIILIAWIFLRLATNAPPSSSSLNAGCALPSFHFFYAYVPTPLSGGSGTSTALGPVIDRINDLDVTAANEGVFHETLGKHCLAIITWRPEGSVNTYKFSLTPQDYLTALNANAGIALSIAGGRNPF
jgi:hypothetical protein